MRAMPSPTSRTRPTSPASSREWYSSISFCKTETISLALNLMTASRDYLMANLFQTRTHRGIIQPVPHPDAQTAQKAGVQLALHDGFKMKGIPNSLLQADLLVIWQGYRRLDLDPDSAAALIIQFPVGGQNRPQEIKPFLVVEHQEEM